MQPTKSEAKRLKELRQSLRRGYLNRLVDEIGFTRQYISRILNGGDAPAATRLKVINAAIKMEERERQEEAKVEKLINSI